MADARGRRHRFPVAADACPGCRHRPDHNRPGYRLPGGHRRLRRAAARSGRTALQDTLAGPRPCQAARPPRRAPLRRLGAPGAASLVAGPSRLRPDRRSASFPGLGREVRGGAAARVRLAPGFGRHDPPRGPAAARQGPGRPVGLPATTPPAARVAALRHRLCRRGRPASLAVRPGPAPAARELDLSEQCKMGTRQKPRPPRARPARGAGRRTASRPSPATRYPSMKDGPMRWISVGLATEGGNARCTAASRQ